jgi:hypothetical protein
MKEVSPRELPSSPPPSHTASGRTSEVLIGRRGLLKATAVFGGVSTLSVLTASAQAGETESGAARHEESKMADIRVSSNAKVTVERRDQIVLIGINRPYIQNRIDPEAYNALAKAYYQYEHDPSLRAAVLFGHGDNFSRHNIVLSTEPRISRKAAKQKRKAVHRFTGASDRRLVLHKTSA